MQKVGPSKLFIYDYLTFSFAKVSLRVHQKSLTQLGTFTKKFPYCEPHSSEIPDSIEKNAAKVSMVFFINIGLYQHVRRGILTF